MTVRSPAPFPDRLALARRMIARESPVMPVHLADQFRAASADTRRWHDRLGDVLPAIEPTRTWRQRIDDAPSDDTRAILLAALLGCVETCVHLRRGGPRPAVARLPLRRVDCERCACTIRSTVTAADECDVCGTRDVVVFHPFATRQGPLMLAGDACPDCARKLGIAQTGSEVA